MSSYVLKILTALRLPVCLILGFLAVSSGASAADADLSPEAQHGKRLFLYCAACHSLIAGQPDKVGPNLHGVIGAPAATRGSFIYSAALKASGIVWTDDKLDAWLKQPSALVPGTKMAFVGLPKDQDRADLLAYLKEAAK